MLFGSSCAIDQRGNVLCQALQGHPFVGKARFINGSWHAADNTACLALVEAITPFLFHGLHPFQQTGTWEVWGKNRTNAQPASARFLRHAMA
jgi:hypothetical protein